MLRLNGPLFEENTGLNGGDGGSAEAAKPLTEEDVGKLVNASVNAAVTSQLKRMLAPAVTEAIGGLKLESKIAEAIKAAQPAEPAPGALGDAPKPDPRLSALESKYAELEKRYQAEQEARAEAEKKGRDAAARAALKAALEPHISGTQLEVASRYLYDAQGVVTFDEDGTPLVKSKRAPMRGMPEEDVFLPIADGVNEWIKSEEAKIFLPPHKPTPGKQSPGAPSLRRGSEMPRYDSPATTEDEKIQRATEREHALLSRLGIT
jgi:hypothetical protein